MKNYIGYSLGGMFAGFFFCIMLVWGNPLYGLMSTFSIGMSVVMDSIMMLIVFVVTLAIGINKNNVGLLLFSVAFLLFGVICEVWVLKTIDFI